MGRRTKEELLAANYYAWLEEFNRLKALKKSGTKLTKEQKAFMREVPTAEKPYKGSSAGVAAPPSPAPSRKKKDVETVSFDSTIEFKVKGNSFLCEAKNLPRTDEDCILFCEVDGCPFNGKGYFREKGLKF